MSYMDQAAAVENFRYREAVILGLLAGLYALNGARVEWLHDCMQVTLPAGVTHIECEITFQGPF